MFASVGTSRLAGQEGVGTCSLVLVRWYIAFSRAGGGRDMFASVGTSRLAGQEGAGTCSLVLLHRV